MLDYLNQIKSAAMRQSDIQIENQGFCISQQAARLLLCKCFQFPIPILTLLLIEEQRIEHTHSTHQIGIFSDILPWQCQIKLAQFKVMP